MLIFNCIISVAQFLSLLRHIQGLHHVHINRQGRYITCHCSAAVFQRAAHQAHTVIAPATNGQECVIHWHERDKLKLNLKLWIMLNFCVCDQITLNGLFFCKSYELIFKSCSISTFELHLFLLFHSMYLSTTHQNIQTKWSSWLDSTFEQIQYRHCHTFVTDLLSHLWYLTI